MKSINLILKVEIESTLKDLQEKLLEYVSKNKKYKFCINFCCNFDTSKYNEKDFAQNIKLYSCEKENINELVNKIICDSEENYTITCSLNDRNWEHKLNKIIENMEEGIEICRVSKFYLPKNVFYKVMNFFIKIWHCFINIFTGVNKNLNDTDPNFQGFTQGPIKIMKTLKTEMFAFRNTNNLLFFKEKNLFLKNNNLSQKIEHTSKTKLTKNQIIALSVLFVGILFVLLSFPLLLNIYMAKKALFKFVVFDSIIFLSSFCFGFCLFFNEEAKKILY